MTDIALLYVYINAFLLGRDYDLKEFTWYGKIIVVLLMLALALPINLFNALEASCTGRGAIRRFVLVCKDTLKLLRFKQYFVKGPKSLAQYRQNACVFINHQKDDSDFIVRLHIKVAKKLIAKIDKHELSIKPQP